ncbi:hypothetical protein HHL16_20530 [Pseudoflavitalea sp. G-6-1-2]|uniref:hypothetical protein n=1 Tax=Pseudoflavitalea sp. G-6-1-2 TaxID=2728841 RepID=UPI00146B8B66|nr:hypothetical protein [Pseudoflavitalea sp. G-6-1-2]NML23277.1 hypothetical protein [Pseudoflavitalea sp. G-6-1-2]
MKIFYIPLAIFLLFVSCKKDNEKEENYNTCGIVKVTNQYTNSQTQSALLAFNTKGQLDSVISDVYGSKLLRKLIRDPQTGRINAIRIYGSADAVLTYNDAGQLIKTEAGAARMTYEYAEGKLLKATYHTQKFEAPPGLTPRSEFYPEFNTEGNMTRLTEKDLYHGFRFVTTFDYTNIPNPCRDLGYVNMLAMAGFVTPTNFVFQNGFTGCFDNGPFMVKSYRKVVYNERGVEENITEGTLQYTFDEKGRMLTSQPIIKDLTTNITLAFDKQTYAYGCK